MRLTSPCICTRAQEYKNHDRSKSTRTRSAYPTNTSTPTLSTQPPNATTQYPHSPPSNKLSLATKLNPPKGLTWPSGKQSSNFFVNTGLSGKSVKS